MATESEQTGIPNISWYQRLHTISRHISNTKKDSESIRLRGKAIRLESESLAKFDQFSTNTCLRDRIDSLRQWMSDLNYLRDELVKVMRRLTNSKVLTEEFLHQITDAIIINVECITHRTTRRDKELVNDPLQEEIEKEKELMQSLQHRLQNLLTDSSEQLILMLNCQNQLNLDMLGKEEAIDIDIEQSNTNVNMNCIGFKPYYNRLPHIGVDLQTWDDINRDLMDQSREEIVKGVALTELMQDELNQAAGKLNNQADLIAEKLRWKLHGLRSSIREHESQKQTLTVERMKLLQDVETWEQARKMINVNIKVAQSRLEARLNHAGKENVTDAAHFSMIKELENLNTSNDGLEEIIAKARKDLGSIENDLGLLCEELRLKNMALTVDETIHRIRGRLQLGSLTYNSRCCDMLPRGIIREGTKFY